VNGALLALAVGLGLGGVTTLLALVLGGRGADQ
jgi:hypothetical protein